ncbi:MAG TPA: hypothetical protein VMX17_09045 [Candidatus Glassbacteria bacterium]|nr:hypothetical protein [Candidatus Glassbacteria bacterium]
MKSKVFECKKSGASVEIKYGKKIAVVNFTGRLGVDLDSAKAFQKTLGEAIKFADGQIDPNANALDKSGTKLFVVKWEEKSRWSGPSSDGMSIHRNKDEFDKYIKSYTRARTGPAPDDYDIPDGPGKLVEVSNIVLKDFEEALKSRNKYGQRVHFNSLEQLEKFLLNKLRG